MSHPAREFTARDEAILAGFKKRLPAYLYRYTGIRGQRAEWFEELVLRAMLFFSPYARLNDPFEGSVPFTFDGSEPEVRAFWKDYLLEKLEEGPEMEAQIDQLVIRASGSENGQKRAGSRSASRIARHGGDSRATLVERGAHRR